MKRFLGFTLIELIITITLTGIIFSIVSVFIPLPIVAYIDVARRANLVDFAEMSIRRIERDIRAAVPNSLRVKTNGSRQAIEFLNIKTAFRYRAEGPGTLDDILLFDIANTSFNVLGNFNAIDLGNNGYRIVIYNLGSFGASTDQPNPGVNVYSSSPSLGPFPPIGSHVITPASTAVTLSNIGQEGRVTLSSTHQFAFQSPVRRMYVVDTPITYICDTNLNEIRRYSNYSITEIQPTLDTIAPLNSANNNLLVNNISSCNFIYTTGTAFRAGLITISLTVSDGIESVNLVRQVGVNNAP